MARSRQGFLRSVEKMVERERADADGVSAPNSSEIDEFHFGQDTSIPIEQPYAKATAKRDFRVEGDDKQEQLNPLAVPLAPPGAGSLPKPAAAQQFRLNFSGDAPAANTPIVELAPVEPATPSARVVRRAPQPAQRRSTIGLVANDVEAPRTGAVGLNPVAKASDARLSSHLREEQDDDVATAAIASAQRSRMPVVVAGGGIAIILAAMVGGYMFNQPAGEPADDGVGPVDVARSDTSPSTQIEQVRTFSVETSLNNATAPDAEMAGFVAPVLEALAPIRPTAFPSLNQTAVEKLANVDTNSVKPLIPVSDTSLEQSLNTADASIGLLTAIGVVLDASARSAPNLDSVDAAVDVFAVAPSATPNYQPLELSPSTEATETEPEVVVANLADIEAVASVAEIEPSETIESNLAAIAADPLPTTPSAQKESGTELATAVIPDVVKAVAATSDLTEGPLTPDIEARPIPAAAIANAQPVWIGELPFAVARVDDQLRLASLQDTPLPTWAQNNDILLAVNGWAVESERDVAFALSQSNMNLNTGKGKATFAITSPNGAPAKVENAQIAFSRAMKSAGGTGFLSEYNGNRWVTRVVTTGSDSDFQIDDKIVRDFASKRKFEDATSMDRLLIWSEQNSIDVLEFAIVRNGAVERAMLNRNGAISSD